MHVRGVDGASQASTHRNTNSLADERAELRARPAGRLEQRRGQLARLALVEPVHEGGRLAAQRAKDRESKDDEARARREGRVVGDLVLVGSAVTLERTVAREPLLVGVVGLEVGGAADVKGLDVQKRRARAVVVPHHKDNREVPTRNGRATAMIRAKPT